MAKPLVERAPEFIYSECDMEKIRPYLNDYGETDDQGRYLHWNILKWRLPSGKEKDIWAAIRFKRWMNEKAIDLYSDNDGKFTYSIPHSIEAKLHQINKIAGGNVGAVDKEAATDNIQRKYLVSSLIME